MTRVIHTGDTHLGYRQYHSGERRADFRRAFEAVAEDAIDDRVDAVVHAGDLFHDRRPDLGDIRAVLAVLRRLDDAGIPFLAVVGNHEATRTDQWLDLFESLGLATRLGTEPVTVGGVAFYGLDHVPEPRRDELDYEFAPHEAGRAALVAHGLFTPFAHADWETETVLSAATVDFDAMLLGDNHEPGTAEVAETWVTYCGSTERASASERDPRGYNLVAFDDGVEIRRRSLADRTREFVFVEVELAPGEGVDRVHERVRQHDVADAVVVVEIDGEGEPVTPATVEEVAAEDGALLTRVTDRREVDTDTETEVSFADPDAAVRERVAEMGLSTAAREIDATVRDGSLADANVRDRVEERIRSQIDDPAAFEPVEGELSAGSVGVDAPASDESSGDDDEVNADRPAADDEATDTDEPSADDTQLSMEEYT